jgi:RimJ/RimL family protein N-acetyltransferase
MPPTEISTPRLLLRPTTEADASAIFDGYATDPLVVRYLTWRAHASLEQSRQFAVWCEQAWASGEAFPYAIVMRETGVMIGMLELRLSGHLVELGYVLARAEWGKGYMSETVKAAVDWCLAQPQIFRVEALCDVDNRASARVMEKAGMKREGRLARRIVHPNLSADPRDAYLYAAVKPSSTR